MASRHLFERLAAIRGMLQKAHQGGGTLSSATKGAERQSFIDLVLGNVIAPPFRVGTGDAIDSSDRRSGQLDIVIEYAVSLSFPLMKHDGPRLYLCEGICSVIEVKSNIAAQWAQYMETQQALSPLHRRWGASVTFGGPPPGERVPLFAIGYEGWKTLDALKERVAAGHADGILVINEGTYCSRAFGCQGSDFALLAFLLDLEASMSTMISAKPNYLAYGQ